MKDTTNEVIGSCFLTKGISRIVRTIAVLTISLFSCRLEDVIDSGYIYTSFIQQIVLDMYD